MEKSVDKLYNVKKIRLERAKQGKSIRELADLAKLDPVYDILKVPQILIENSPREDI